MKKILKVIAVSFCIMVGLTGCGASNDAVKDDLYKFLQEDMAAIQGEQKDAIDSYNSYITDQTKDSQELLTALNDDIIPKYDAYVNKVTALQPETEEVKALQTKYLAGANKQLEALKQVAQAIEECDSDMLTNADQMVTDAETNFADYQTALEQLAKEHSITFSSETSTAKDK